MSCRLLLLCLLLAGPAQAERWDFKAGVGFQRVDRVEMALDRRPG